MWRRLLLLCCAIATLTTLTACDSLHALVSRSASPTPLPFALASPVSPKPGEPFVGYWSGAYDDVRVAIPIEVLRHGTGYAVSVDGGPATPVPLDHGRLVLNRFGPSPEPSFVGYKVELLWQRGHCVLLVWPGPYASRWYPADLTRQSRAAFVKAVDGIADYETFQELADLAQSLQGWVMHTHKPLAPSQLRPDSAFVRWIRSYVRTWPWPHNPFTGQPMSDSPRPGDFSYTVKGLSWKLVGHQSDGGTWDALKGFPSTVPTESPSPRA